jgi:hypothetical protein
VSASNNNVLVNKIFMGIFLGIENAQIIYRGIGKSHIGLAFAPKFVIPAKAGTHPRMAARTWIGSRLRGNDSSFYLMG